MTFIRILHVAALVAAFAAPVGAEATSDEQKPAATPEQIAGWIAKLDDDRYLIREEASQQLLESGTLALDPLLATANGKRLEPADRAVWIMRRMARSRDNDVAIAALERLVKVEGRPALVEKADIELAERIVAACQMKLGPLGAEMTMEPAQFDAISVVLMLHIRLGDKWRGTPEDLQCLAQLRRQNHFRIEGGAVDDAVAKIFAEKEKLEFIQFLDTSVTLASIDLLKSRHPEATVYVRGQALLGIQADPDRKDGIVVKRVELQTAAAAAGIMAGDTIVSMDGRALPDFDRLTAHIAQHKPGETIEVEIMRAGERKKLAVTLGSWSDQEP